MNPGKIFILCLALASFVALTNCRVDSPEGVGVIPEARDRTGLPAPSAFDISIAEPGDYGDPDGAPGARNGEKGWADKTGIPGVSFPTIYFAYDQDTLGSSEQAKLDQIARYLQDNDAVGVVIEGHCDERGSVEYNRCLGERRAITVQTYLINLGISDTRFKTQSFGEERPAIEGSGDAVWRKNRRAELKPKSIK